MRTKTYKQIKDQWGRIASYVYKRYPKGNKFITYLNIWVKYKDNVCEYFHVSDGYMFGRINEAASLANRHVPISIYAKDV